uniref:NAC domain-containing protein 53-like n=1 Tax=Erigeron canadensis TaxID=72917 RepID=UPI001CB9C820|nr:NAC domain-containing protein 53-like [Erigeron canadensis]
MARVAIDTAAAVGGGSSSLAPGFRFHPTDEELVRYYLRRKVCGRPFRVDAISDIDVYKVEPWDLPGLSRLKTRDLEWYFFSMLDKKYGNGCRTNRATEKGYWKTTGKDRTVYHRTQTVGMKKTLVYHIGRAPKGERTNWVMHEYRLVDQELEKAGILQDGFVLCRIFHKSGSGPKNGEKYGAPFIEEEWEDDETIFIPKQEGCIAELPADMDSYLDADEIAQILNSDLPKKDVPLPSSFHQGDNVDYADVSPDATNDSQNSFVDVVGEYEPQVNQYDGSKSFDLPVQTGLEPKSVNYGFTSEPSNNLNFDPNFLLDEPYYDATNGDFPLDENLFFEADDLKGDVETDSGLDILNEYTSLFNPDIDSFNYALGNNILPDSSQTLENMNNGNQQVSEARLPFEGQKLDVAPSSKQGNPDQGTGIAYPFLKKASYMLGNISAPPAFASEFPTKYLDSASQASNLVNVPSGMIRISNVSFNGGAVDLTLGKHTQLNIVLSFGLGQRKVHSVNSYQVEKASSGSSRSWFYCAFVWILVLSLSFKIGSLLCTRSFMT